MESLLSNRTLLLVTTAAAWLLFVAQLTAAIFAHTHAPVLPRWIGIASTASSIAVWWVAFPAGNLTSMPEDLSSNLHETVRRYWRGFFGNAPLILGASSIAYLYLVTLWLAYDLFITSRPGAAHASSGLDRLDVWFFAIPSTFSLLAGTMLLGRQSGKPRDV